MEDDTGRSITRTRPSLTCLPCKRRKVKCDKKRPDCEQCGRFMEKCVYGDPLPQNSSVKRPRKRQRDENTNSTSDCTTESTSQHVISRQQAMRTPSGTIDSQSVLDAATCTLPSPYSTNDSDFAMFQDYIDMIVPSPNYFLTIPNFANPLVPNHSDSLSIEVNHAAVLPQHDWITPFETTSTQAGNISAVDKWVSKTAADTDRVYPALQVTRTTAETSQVEDSAASASPGSYSSETRLCNPFWAFASNRTNDCDLLLRVQQSKSRSRNIDSRRWDDTCKTLLCLPPKTVCDVILGSFLLSVRPLIPLVHGPTLQADYNSFWPAFQRYKVSKKSEELAEHHGFLCLLWAVLFCGAVAASPAMFREASIQVCDIRSLLCRLRAKLDESIITTQFNKMPTLNGLISILLAEECDPDFDETSAAPPFAYKCMRAARTLNLHKEAVVGAKNGVESELARRVWYHVVQLEVLATITSGASLSYYSSEGSYDTCMPNDIHDSDMHLENTSEEKSDTTNNKSSVMQLAIGRCQLNRMLRKVLEKCYGTRPPRETDLEELLLDIARYEEVMDGITARLEVRGLPEQGHIPAKLLKADPTTIHERLYQDDPNKDTVFNAYARIMLNMMKGYVSILTTRHFLSQTNTDADQRSKLWTSGVTVCTKFLHNYLHLAQFPAFSPYRWFCPGKIQPLQECMMILGFLKEFPHHNNNNMLGYLVNEVFDLFGTSDASPSASGLPAPKEKYKAAWEVLESLRQEVMGGKNSPLESGVSPPADRGVGAKCQVHDPVALSLSYPEDETEAWLKALDYMAEAE